MVRNKDTKEHSSLSFMPPIWRSVQSASTRNSVVISQWRWMHQNHHFARRSGIIDAQMAKFGMKSESFYLLQRRMLALSKKKWVTYHSVKKTCISRLLDVDFVAQLSGHNSTKSLQYYKSANSKHQTRMSLTLSRVERSESGDETISSVHNQDLQEATRSTAETATSTTENSLINQSNDP